MSGRTQSSLTLEQVDLLDMVRRAVLRLKDTPHRQYTYVYGAVQQLATEEGKFRPGVTALSGVDQQAILDVLNEMGREGLIVPGLGEAGSSAQDFPFFRVGKKMLESSRAITTAPVPPRQELKKGSVIRTAFQSYTLQKILGEGGVGVVWQATDEEGEMWAIKVLRPKSSTSKAKRFKNELTFCRNSRHPHIINVHDHGVGGDYNQTFYVMKMLDGSLRQLLPSIPDGKQRMVYIGHILAGAEAAHMQGVVHRDIKPENILLDRRENKLLLADFGVAEFSEEDLYTIVETNDNERLGIFNTRLQSSDLADEW